MEGGRGWAGEGVGQRKDFFKSSVALKESLYLAGFREPVNMYFATQTAIVGAPEKCKKVKEKDITGKIGQYILSSADSKNSSFCLLQPLIMHIPEF